MSSKDEIDAAQGVDSLLRTVGTPPRGQRHASPGTINNLRASYRADESPGDRLSRDAAVKPLRYDELQRFSRTLRHDETSDNLPHPPKPKKERRRERRGDHR